MNDDERIRWGFRPWAANGVTVKQAQEMLLKSMGSALNPLDKDGRPTPDRPVREGARSQASGARNRNAETGTRPADLAEERNPWTDPDTPGWCRATERDKIHTKVPWHRLYQDVIVDGIYDCFNKDGSIERVPGTSRNRDWFIQDEDERRLEGEKQPYRGSFYKDILPERLRYHYRPYGFDPAESHVPELREWARRYRSR